MSTHNLDSAIRHCYAQQDLSMDEILCRPQTALKFAESISALVPDAPDTEAILHRALNLRKLKGGLPRRPK